MKRSIAILVLVAPFVVIPAAAMADVYKWTDAQGHVHFGDKPKDQKINAEQVEVKDYKPGTDDAVRQINERRDRLRNAGDADALDKKAAADTLAREKSDAKAESCKQQREKLRMLSGRVEFYDRDGKQVKVTEQERSERQRAQEAWLRQNCP